jgi:hypothetical protein
MLRPVAIVLDDSHAGVEEIRDAFTLSACGDALNVELLRILNDACSNYKSSIWTDIRSGDPNRSMEVPFWIWKPLLREVEAAIANHCGTGKSQFVAPYLSDILRWCRCVVCGSGIELVPDVLPVHKIPAFREAAHRLFMSATLADDSVLVRELDCSMKAAGQPVVPANDKGIGERMVLAPSLVHESLDRQWIMSTCQKISARRAVVVLAPSEKLARGWEKAGAQVFLGDSVSKAVEQLKSGEVRFAVFVQRYDGVDLPDSACRVLVLDGMPFGEGIVDRHDGSMNSVGSVRNRPAYRIEQGMGRAVRSYADYAVVLLAGADLAHYIARHDVLGAMNPGTRAQLQLAIDLAKLAMEEAETTPEQAVVDMMRKCLTRDEGWKQFYNESVRSIDRSGAQQSDPRRLALADAERRAFEEALANDPSKAAATLRAAMNQNLGEGEQMAAWLLQRVANYLFDDDPGEAIEVQRAAFQKNPSAFCPPGAVKRPAPQGKFALQEVVRRWFGQFRNPNGAIAFVQELRTNLSCERPPAVVEEALCDLANLVGAEGTRPEKEYGEGPDDLWLWPDVSAVIEAKTGNEETLHKKDAGQLLLSLQWFTNSYKTRGEAMAIIVARTNIADRNAGFPTGTRVLLPDGINRLLDNLAALFREMAAKPLLAANARGLYELQASLHLLPSDFAKAYTAALETSRK